MTTTQSKLVFWLAMLIAQVGAFIIFKDLADISQWLVQSTREFTMTIWYNRHVIGIVAFVALLISLLVWWKEKAICSKVLLSFLVLFFVFNYYSGMINPKWMFRSQQHAANFVAVDEAENYMQRSLHLAHFGPDSYASVDDINVLVLETDNGAYAYSDYYLLQPHVVQGDTIDGEEVIMTYCGLTNLGIAYSPVIENKKLDLTVMTQLKNNLVMFDKNSGEAIQQIWGSMERDETKKQMREWPTIRMPFSSFKKLYPEGRVFINEIAGFTENPVLAIWDRVVRHVMMLWGVGLNWVDNDKPAFPTIDFKDKRLPMKELIYSISINGDHVAYSKDFVKEQGNTINVGIGGEEVVVDYDEEFDSITAFYNSTNLAITDVDVFGLTSDGVQLKRVNTLKSRLFWFIFVEFFPDTDVNRV
ncbi:MAG: DUF3179 domain-containing protein [Gammaproteobacteria bacterium]|mgnify:CR=1 FL=1|jgi:hypothetical protein|nr:DUF3179 domain-containing protein [Gammaproteobacteria bacterium]